MPSKRVRNLIEREYEIRTLGLPYSFLVDFARPKYRNLQMQYCYNVNIRNARSQPILGLLIKRFWHRALIDLT